ncbi:MAG: hypothetical protein U0892_00845 [Pirellulales bacterium]
MIHKVIDAGNCRRSDARPCTALSDPSGKLLIEYDTTLELPKEDTKITIDIPKGGNGKSKPADQAKPEI